jgi:hypothetical protein
MSPMGHYRRRAQRVAESALPPITDLEADKRICSDVPEGDIAEPTRLLRRSPRITQGAGARVGLRAGLSPAASAFSSALTSPC